MANDIYSTVTDEQLVELHRTALREAAGYENEIGRRHRERFPHKHVIDIRTRYGPAERECYCTATDGARHSEGSSPWIGEDGLRVTV